MYFNDYIGEALAGRKSVIKGDRGDGGQQYVLRTKRWDRNTGQTEYEEETITLDELLAQRASLQAKIAQLNRLIGDVQKL